MDNNKISLNKLINKSLISNTFIAIPLVIIIITFLYFFTVLNFSSFLEDKLIESETEKKSDLLSKEIEIISLKLSNIENIDKDLLNESTNTKQLLLLLDSDGSHLTMSNETKKLFTKYSDYESKINFFIKKIFNSDEKHNTVMLDGQAFMITQSTIPELNWKLLTFTNKTSLLEPLVHIKETFIKAGVYLVILIFILYSFFMLTLIQRSKKLATLITEPIKRLSYSTKNLDPKLAEKHLLHSDILEIDRLNQNFIDFSKELDCKTKDLVKTELEKNKKTQEAELYYLTSITEPLTKLYNRLKIVEILDYEINQTIRYGQDLSVIFLDIDKFKKINDNFGHDIGDEVLVDIANILRNSVRDTDSVGRWGGEEFIIICTNTSLKNAAILAEKLRILIGSFKFSTEQTQTASFGIAAYETGDDKRSLVQKADAAMYEAKKTSRNVVMVYRENMRQKIENL